MADITVEKRKSPPYPSLSASPRKIEFEDRKRILFHINSFQGFPSNQTGWQPTPSIFISVECLETKESYPTDLKKHNPLISWGENMPLMDLRNTSKVRFEIRRQVLWKNKTTLGSSDVLDVAELLEMQNRVGDGRDDFIELSVRFKSSKSAPNGVLTLSIREMAMKDHNAFITAADHQRFVEMCQRQSLEELRNFVAKIVRFRKMLNADESSLACIVDIILGASEGVYQAITKLVTKHINKNTVAIFQALSDAFTPYENVSARYLAKNSEERTKLLRDMLCGTIKAFEGVINFLRMPDKFISDKLEFKVTHWIRYFEECAKFLLVKEAQRPIPRLHGARRVKCPARMVVNNDLPTTQNMLPMELPSTSLSGGYCRSDLVKLIAEWAFSPASFEEKMLNDKGKGKGNGKGKESLEGQAFPLDQDKERNGNVFCLSGSAGCGKSQLVSNLVLCLGDLGCLGGYFSLDLDRSSDSIPNPSSENAKDSIPESSTVTKLTSSQVLHALPITLAHQLSVVEPDTAGQLAAAITKNPGASIGNGNLEANFEKLFVEPLKEFEKARVKPEWNPLEPLIFVIDGIVIDGSEGNDQGASEQKVDDTVSRTISALAELLTSKAVARLPKHIKFIVLCRVGSGLGEMLEERCVGCVYELEPVAGNTYAADVYVPGSGSSRRMGGGSCLGSPEGSGGAAGGRNVNLKFSIQSF